MDVKDVGYARKLVLNEAIPPSLLKAYGHKAVVVWRGTPLEGHVPVASIGSLSLYVMDRARVPPPSAQCVVVEPVLCARRGRPVPSERDDGKDTRVGIDDEVCTSTYRVDELAEGGRKSLPLEEEPGAVPPVELAHEDALFISGLELIGLPQVKTLLGDTGVLPRVAIIDASFAGLPKDSPTPRFVGLPREPPLRSTFVRTVAAHGTRMAVALREALGGAVELGLYRVVPMEVDIHCSWIAPTDVALALADAIEQWKADVVLIPMGDGLWGTPRHLQEVLREARRTGRGGKGVPIICATGDASWNHDEGLEGMSYAMGADELHSQPWVIAVAAADATGRWYRRFERTLCGPLSRFGPSVALCAPGEIYRLRTLGDLMVDDTSIASALVAASAAVVLRQAPELDADEVRALLQWTADPAPIVDSGPGPARDVFNEWDRLGHNLKLGAGRVNALAATLAASDPVCAALLLTRPCPGRLPTRGVVESEPAFLRALAWDGWMRRAPAPLGAPWHVLREDYLRVRGRLARLMLHAWRWREALMWLARHLMALWRTGGELLDPEGERDHGALVRRVAHMLEALRAELETPAFRDEAPALHPWLEKMERVLQDVSGGQLQRFLFGVDGAFASSWIPAAPDSFAVDPPPSTPSVG